jgi:polyribonucleotide 5'-hydroxyl-kinase
MHHSFCLQYFYGTRQQSYNPHTFELSYDEVTIVKIGADEVPDSCLPFGMKPEEHRTKVVTVPINAQLVHHLFGVSTAESITDVLTSNMAGFICITRVDSEKRTISVVSPQPYPLPRTILVLSDVTFDDDNARE